MRVVKIAGYIIGGLVALVVVALLLILLFVDPNDYRDDIERLVERQTGRTLVLSGDLKLSVFPWLALQTGAASLGEAPGFGAGPFVSIQEARVSARLLPLLRGRFEVGSVKLAGARIQLITDEQGRNNWDDLAGRKGQEEEAAGQKDGTGPLPTIAGLEIQDAALIIENHQENTRREIRDFNLKTGRLASGEPFDLETTFLLDHDSIFSIKVHLVTHVTADLERNVHQLAEPEIDVTLLGQGYPLEGVPVQIRANAIAADIGRERYRLDALNVTTTWKGDGFPPAGIPVSFRTDHLGLDLAAQTMELTGLQLQAAGARLEGELSGSGILDEPRIAGPLKLEPISPREWLPKLGIELPVTRDPEVFGRLSFSSNVKLGKSSAEFEDMVMQLDDTTAKGMLGIADFDTMALRFDLSVDRIDADRYLPPPEQDVDAKAGEEAPTPLPVDALRTLNARGQLMMQEATFAGIRFTNLKLGVNARDGKLRFHPVEASMYGGQYRGDIGIDATGKAARVTLDEHVSGVDFSPLFRDLFETDKVSGKGSANIKGAGVGRTIDDIVSTLDGAIDFSVADGALEGADLWYEIRRARALLKQQAAPERTGPARTTFTALSGTGVIRKGVMSNDDLNVAMQYLKVDGKGTVDIPASTLDYRLVATVLKIPRESALGEEMQDVIDAQIPVTVSGALADPKVRPDVEGYLKGKVQERIEKEKEKVEEKIKDKLGDKLKDIFKR